MSWDITYATLTRRTLFTVAVGYIVLFIIGISLGGRFDVAGLAFILPIIVIPALIGFALWRWSGKTFIVATVGGVALLILAIPPAGLANPTSTLDFVFQAFGPIAGLVVIYASIRAFRGRHAVTLPGPSMQEQYVVVAMIVVPALVAVGGLIGWLAGGSGVSDDERAGAVVVVMDDFDFKTETVNAASGKVLIANDDVFTHAFTVEDLVIDEFVNPGREAVIDLSDKPAGTYDVTCSIPGHESMEATLVIS